MSKRFEFNNRRTEKPIVAGEDYVLTKKLRIEWAAQLVIEPAYKEITNVNINGRPSKRLLLVLRTNGCTHNWNNTGCTMCGFRFLAISRKLLKIDQNHLIRQYENGIKYVKYGSNGVEQIDLFTPGSFLNEKEVEPTFCFEVMQKIASLKEIKKVVIESRTEYITGKKLSKLKSLIREDQILELGIGVESSNDRIRNRIINKGLPWHNIERAIEICAKCEVEFQPYLLIKPQTLNEREAIDDAVRSAEDVASLADKYNVPFRIAFEPIFIAKDTKLERAYSVGKYSIVSLWSVIEILKRTHHLGIIFVGLSDENISDGRKPSSCPLCTDKLIKAIEEFNGQQKIQIFDLVSCSCKKEWEGLISKPDERI